MLSEVDYLTSAQARSLRAKRAGQKRIAYWRPLGVPNLILARVRRAELRRLWETMIELELLQQTVSRAGDKRLLRPVDATPRLSALTHPVSKSRGRRQRVERFEFARGGPGLVGFNLLL
jgi:hypothetical protein